MLGFLAPTQPTRLAIALKAEKEKTSLSDFQYHQKSDIFKL
ncbi:hypothetical protein [Nostoc sp.]